MSRRNQLMDRRALFSSAVAATLLAATGVSAAGLPRRGGRLRMALSGASRSDDWVQGDGLFMQVARIGLVFDALTEVAADGTLRAELATDWQASDEARVWTFAMRRNVRFHDGAPLTARDAATSLQAALGPAADCVARGADVLRIALADPDPSLPLRLAAPEFAIRPAHAPDAGIGTGLYRVRRFTPGQQLLGTRVASHYKDGAAGWFDEVELNSVPSEAVRAQALGERMVDATDLRDVHVLADLDHVTILPDAARPTQAVSRALFLPAQVGSRHPLDDLRAAERWWFA